MFEYLFFNTSTEFLRLPPDSIVYITADGNYSEITTADGGKYLVTLQLGDIERQISNTHRRYDNMFIRIGRSLIVNRSYITRISPGRQKIVLSDCREFCYEVTASREALKELKECFEREVRR